MTREEKISHLKGILSEINENDNAVCYLTSEDNELIESAIEALEQESQTFEWCTDCREYDQEKHCCHRWSKVIWNAVEKMKQPCENAISRQEVIETLKELDWRYNGHPGREVYGAIMELPSVRPQPKTGHWIEVEKYSDGKHKIKCSECRSHIIDRGHANSYVVKEKYKYCPRCGAKMIEPQESEE